MIFFICRLFGFLLLALPDFKPIKINSYYLIVLSGWLRFSHLMSLKMPDLIPMKKFQ